MDVNRAGPQLLRADTRKGDRRLPVHARRLCGVGIELVVRHDAHTIVFPWRRCRIG
jgi:hypothetical protein